MKAFRATYTPNPGTMKWDAKAKTWVSAGDTRILVVKICEPESELNPKVVFIDSNGELRMDTMDCFSDCQWEEGIKVVGR